MHLVRHELYHRRVQLLRRRSFVLIVLGLLLGVLLVDKHLPVHVG